MSRPALPVILGRGPIADAMRAQVARDPDRYLPVTISIVPSGVCPCCEQDVYCVTSKVTAWEPGYATGIETDAILHPLVEGGVGCCCIAPNWGPKHGPKERAKR